MKTNKEIAEIVKAKTIKIGEWSIAPNYQTRMNRTTLGLETGSGKQGGRVWWFNWGVWYGEVKFSPFETFESLSAAKSFVRDRIKRRSIVIGESQKERDFISRHAPETK